MKSILHRYFLLLLIVFLAGFCSVSVLAQSQRIANSEVIYQNLSEKWLIYDREIDNYLPYLPTFHQNYQALHLIFDFENNSQDYQNRYLGVVLPASSQLFWNTNFSSFVEKDSLFQISFDSLRKNYQNSRFVMLTVYNTSKSWFEPYPAYILSSPTNLVKSLPQAKKIRLDSLQRPPNWLFNWLLIINWTVVGTIVLFSVGVYSIVGSEALKEAWDYFFRPAKALKRTELLPQISYIVYFGLVMGFAWFFYQKVTSLEENLNTTSLFSDWLYTVFWCCLIAMLRLVSIQIISKLFFRSSQIVEQHTQALVLSNNFVMGFVLLITVFVSLWSDSLYNTNSSNFFHLTKTDLLTSYAFLVGGAILAQTFLVSYYLFVRGNTGKLYLFSYLCETEIIPLLIAFKWFFSMS